MRRRDLTPREIKSGLRTLRPADAAFVLHLARCERCRSSAARLFTFDEEIAAIRRSYWLAVTEDTPQDDLPPFELMRFLDALSPGKADLIRHLLGCEQCRRAAAKILAPPSAQA